MRRTAQQGGEGAGQGSDREQRAWHWPMTTAAMWPGAHGHWLYFAVLRVQQSTTRNACSLQQGSQETSGVFPPSACISCLVASNTPPPPDLGVKAHPGAMHLPPNPRGSPEFQVSRFLIGSFPPD